MELGRSERPCGRFNLEREDGGDPGVHRRHELDVDPMICRGDDEFSNHDSSGPEKGLDSLATMKVE